MFALCISFAKFLVLCRLPGSSDCYKVSLWHLNRRLDVPLLTVLTSRAPTLSQKVFVVIVIRKLILCKVGGGPNICSGLFFSVFGFGGQWLVYEAARSWRKLPVTLYLLLPPALLASTVKLWLKLSQEKIRFQGRPTDLLNIGEHQVCPFHNTE